MQFIIDEDYFKIIRITGNHRNLLAIKFADSESPITINGLSNERKETINLQAKEVLDNVLKGLNQANSKLKKTFFIEEVQYIVSDTKPYEVYSFLTESLICHVESKGVFIPALSISSENVTIVELLTIDFNIKKA